LNLLAEPRNPLGKGLAAEPVRFCMMMAAANPAATAPCNNCLRILADTAHFKGRKAI